ncbi:MAG TPA: DUF2304 domain-containing protein [Oligoflexia bacterium]|nr:DUF2304 domain-containing protein [Oligoflexia bacterium]
MINYFQAAGGIIVVLLAVRVYKSYRRCQISFVAVSFWLAVCASAFVCIANPRLTVLAARFLGIGRGADLVFYVTTLALLGGFYYISLQLRRLSLHVTRLTRELCLTQQFLTEGKPGEFAQRFETLACLHDPSEEGAK